MIWLDGGFNKSIFYKPHRKGEADESFKCFKFRTMSECDNPKNGTRSTVKNDPRITRVGKFLRKYDLDELPQFINVLKGDMSIIGPRPLLVEYLPLYNETQKRRHHVKPGITGWAQINGRNAISWEDKFTLDVYYVENQSFLLDLKIIFLTIKKVFVSEGISQIGQATTTKFEGS